MAVRESAVESGPIPQMVTHAVYWEREDADTHHPLTARLSAGCVAGLRDVYGAAAAGRPEQDALLPGRGPLGAEAKELRAVECGGQRLVRPVDTLRQVCDGGQIEEGPHWRALFMYSGLLSCSACDGGPKWRLRRFRSPAV